MKQCMDAVKCFKVDGETNVINDFSYGYTISYEKTETCKPSDIYLNISYISDTLINEKDFTGPHQMIMKKRHDTIILPIRFHSDKNTDGHILKISILSPSSEEQCSEFSINVNLSISHEQPPCDTLFFFKPYGHQTKKARNMG